ncbi:nucleolin [Clonorchis sinensis]|uniref:Nucleolin n=1 Tax=Clonorchis sinensis TaxID=79923 RepID=A0A419QE16_CLOSI|nr:nucleolin [Clonorchis sinensis]
MQSTGRDSIRASKKRRHSRGLDGTPVSEKTKELFHTVPRNATMSRNPKRVREGDDEESSNAANAVLQSPGSPTIKRPRKKPSLLGSSDLQKYEGTYTSSTELTLQPGQKVALLSMIRQRLAELNNRTLYVRKLPRNTSLAQLKALCPTSINARLPTKAFSNRRRHAFIEFKSEELARKALKSIVGKLIADRPIKAELCFERSSTETNRNTDRGQKESGGKPIQWAKPNERQLRDFSLTTLHISCVPRNTTPDEIRQLFPQAVSFDFNMHPKDKGIGSCRVAFSSEQDAFQAFTSQHNAVIRDCPIIVNFAFKKHKPTGNVIQTVNTQIPSTQLIENKHKLSMKVDEQSKETPSKAHAVFGEQQKEPQSTTETTTGPKQKKKQKKSLSRTSSPNDFPFPKQPKAKKHKLT